MGKSAQKPSRRQRAAVVERLGEDDRTIARVDYEACGQHEALGRAFPGGIPRQVVDGEVAFEAVEGVGPEANVGSADPLRARLTFQLARCGAAIGYYEAHEVIAGTEGRRLASLREVVALLRQHPEFVAGRKLLIPGTMLRDLFGNEGEEECALFAIPTPTERGHRLDWEPLTRVCSEVDRQPLEIEPDTWLVSVWQAPETDMPSDRGERSRRERMHVLETEVVQDVFVDYDYPLSSIEDLVRDFRSITRAWHRTEILFEPAPCRRGDRRVGQSRSELTLTRCRGPLSLEEGKTLIGCQGNLPALLEEGITALRACPERFHRRVILLGTLGREERPTNPAKPSVYVVVFDGHPGEGGEPALRLCNVNPDGERDANDVPALQIDDETWLLGCRPC